MEEEEQVVPLQQERVVEGEYILEQQGEGEGESYTIHTQQFAGEEEDVQFDQRREEDEGEDDDGPSLSNMRYKISGEAEGGQQMVVQVLPKADCHAYVIARTVKELRDLGRDMLRIHAENHGVEHAGKLRMSELVREMIQHYNGVHNAGMEVSKLDMLKLNMLQLKKIKVDIREKTPPPDTANMVPKKCGADRGTGAPCVRKATRHLHRGDYCEQSEGHAGSWNLYSEARGKQAQGV